MPGRRVRPSVTLVCVAIKGNIATRGRRVVAPTSTAVVALTLFGLCFLVYLLTVQRTAGHVDYRSAHIAAWHLVETGTPWFPHGEIPHFEDVSDNGVWVREAPDGRDIITRAPGVVAASLPAYAVAGGHAFSMTPGALTAVVVTAATVVLMFLALRSRLDVAPATAVALVLAFATPLWTVSADGVWPHTITGLGIAGMAWSASRERWWWCGVFGGIALWGRLHTAVIAAVVGLLAGRRNPAATMRVALPSLGFLVLQMGWTRWMYGSWNPMSIYGGGTAIAGASTSHVDPVNQLGMWFAPDRGILVWTPVLLVLLPALRRTWPTLPPWSKHLLLGGLSYTVVQASLITFTGGAFFYGYRLGIEFLVCATPAFAFSLERTGRVARAAIGPVVAIQLLAMAVGSVSSVWVLEDRVWRENAFVKAMIQGGPASLLLIVMTLTAGAVLSHVVLRRAPRVDDRVPV